MNCFNKKTTNKTPRELPSGLVYDKLYPNYNVTKFENSYKKKLKKKKKKN